MAFRTKRHVRASAEIPTASMADIAFLLMIFFLATTTMITDRGIGMVLPKWRDQSTPPVQIPPERMIKVWINQYDRVAIDFQEVEIRQIAQIVRDILIADTKDEKIVSLKTHPDASYNVMIKVLDQIEEAYASLPPGVSRTKRVSLATPGPMATAEGQG